MLNWERQREGLTDAVLLGEFINMTSMGITEFRRRNGLKENRRLQGWGAEWLCFLLTAQFLKGRDHKKLWMCSLRKSSACVADRQENNPETYVVTKAM